MQMITRILVSLTLLVSQSFGNAPADVGNSPSLGDLLASAFGNAPDFPSGGKWQTIQPTGQNPAPLCRLPVETLWRQAAGPLARMRNCQTHHAAFDSGKLYYHGQCLGHSKRTNIIIRAFFWHDRVETRLTLGILRQQRQFRATQVRIGECT